MSVESSAFMKHTAHPAEKRTFLSGALRCIRLFLQLLRRWISHGHFYHMRENMKRNNGKWVEKFHSQPIFIYVSKNISFPYVFSEHDLSKPEMLKYSFAKIDNLMI